jgi:hypothetical protein
MTAEERRYRIVWESTWSTVASGAKAKGVMCPGPFTHDEACTALAKFNPAHLRFRRVFLEEVQP